MTNPSRKRSTRLLLEFLEDRLNPAPTVLPGSPYTLPGDPTSWAAYFRSGASPLNASPVIASVDGDSQDEAFIVGADRAIHAYKYSANAGVMVQDHVYNTIGFGFDPGFIQATPIVVTLPSGPAVFAGTTLGYIFGWDARSGGLIPGWPTLVPPSLNAFPNRGIYAPLVAGDLEQTGVPDIVATSATCETYCYHANGSLFWSYDNDDTVLSGAAIGDINNDGRLDVVVGGDSSGGGSYIAGGHVTALSWNGKREWVKQIDQVVWSSPVLADLQGNGRLDIVVGTGYFYGGPPWPGNQVWALDGNGNVLPGWPYTTEPSSTDGRVFTSPVVGDVFGTGQFDVVVEDASWKIHVIGPNGQSVLPNGPIQAFQPVSPPYPELVLADVNGTGQQDIVTLADNEVNAFDPRTSGVAWSFNEFRNFAGHGFAHYNGPAVGHLKGDGTWQMVVVGNTRNSDASLNGPAGFEVFDLGGVATPEWAQFRQTSSSNVVIRSSVWATNYVTNLFLEALGRRPGPSELSAWVQVFVHAPSLRDAVLGIVASAEARSRQINFAYANYLGRLPDQTGINGWLNFLASGQSYASLGANIIASQESFNRAGGTNAVWITYLYQKVLGRTPSAAEINGWVNALNSGVPRGQVALSFFLSAEHTNGYVGLIYNTYVPGGVAALTPDEFQAMGMDLRRGRPEEQVIADVLADGYDYLQSQLDGSFVRAAYLDVLLRAPAPSEVASWLQQIEGGTTLGQIASVFTHSPEYTGHIVDTYFSLYLHRAPSPQERAAFTNELLSGVTRNTFGIQLVSSAEFWNDAGGDPTTFVNNAYLAILGRPASSSDLATWVGRPDVRTALPQTLLIGFPNEYYSHFVIITYYDFLRRFPASQADSSRIIPPSAGTGTDGWVNVLLGGASQADVEALILSSPEYQDIALFKDFWSGQRWVS
jgi:hypothetical protein